MMDGLQDLENFVLPTFEGEPAYGSQETWSAVGSRSDHSEVYLRGLSGTNGRPETMSAGKSSWMRNGERHAKGLEA